ncbi:MAG: hypothetical protein H8E27_07335 [Verrucomicrobia subdivision 3 bacterium]|nr:hypothetical protein [Limisphaerales bacterium]
MILILVTAGLTSGATFWMVSTGHSSARDEAASDLVRTNEETKAGMRGELNAAKARAAVIVTVDGHEAQEPTVATVQEILARLQELKPGDTRVKRRAVYFLESLVDRGDAALPGIANFLERNVDLELGSLDPPKAQAAKEKKTAGDKSNGKEGKKLAASAWNYFRPFPKPNDEFPATLRLGLLEVVAAIGSEQAEQLLLKILENTRRGVEVAYLETALQEIARDLYVDKILEATRRLLTELPPITADSMAVDRRAKGFLYAILVKYKDLVFVDTAKTLLITADGRLDGDVLRYLRQVLGTDALPIFHTVMNDDRLTDDLDRYAIRDAILRHIGADPKADVLLMQTMREGMAQQEESGALNWGAIKLPLSALMQGINEAPAQNIANRRRLIENFRDEFDHPQLNSVLNKMDAGLEAAQQGVIRGGSK